MDGVIAPTIKESGDFTASIGKTKPGDDWRGEKGRLDSPMIERLCGGDLPERAFYVCAPPALMDGVIKCLRAHGVPAKNIHFERFNL